MRNNRQRFHWIATLVLVLVAALSWLIHFAWTWSDRFMTPARVGMSMSEIRTQLGEPPVILKHADGRESWDYRHWWSSDARIDFTTNKTVAGIDTD